MSFKVLKFRILKFLRFFFWHLDFGKVNSFYLIQKLEVIALHPHWCCLCNNTDCWQHKELPYSIFFQNYVSGFLFFNFFLPFPICPVLAGVFHLPLCWFPTKEKMKISWWNTTCFYFIELMAEEERKCFVWESDRTFLGERERMYYFFFFFGLLDSFLWLLLFFLSTVIYTNVRELLSSSLGRTSCFLGYLDVFLSRYCKFSFLQEYECVERNTYFIDCLSLTLSMENL